MGYIMERASAEWNTFVWYIDTHNTVSFPGCAETLESSDLILNLGPLLSDSNTGGFSRHITDSQLVLLGHDHCQVHEKKYESVHFLPILKRIVEELEEKPAQYRIPRTDAFTKVEVFI
jgi:pyruvate decarboxylase